MATVREQDESELKTGISFSTPLAIVHCYRCFATTLTPSVIAVSRRGSATLFAVG
jgi:hypothetical protein